MKRGGKANGTAVSNGNAENAEMKNNGAHNAKRATTQESSDTHNGTKAKEEDSVQQHASNGHSAMEQQQQQADEGKKKKKKTGGKFWNKFAGLARSDVKTEWKDYDKTFTQTNGEGIRDKDHTEDGVDTFYNLVTDIYEWGWGPSFHFSPQLKGKTVEESSIAHEIRISDTLGLKPGTMALDVGCGIGGPLITIASHSGAKIVGLTINKYQVERCRARATKAGLRDGQDFEVLRGNFLNLSDQFEENSVDNAYAIEATCHSPDLAKAYSEIYRVLKPGGKFVNYEWVSTATFEESNAGHVKCIDDINYANALPEMRKHSEIGKVAKQVGFHVLEQRDLAAGPNANEWWGVLKTSMQKYKFNDILIKILSFFRIVPKNTKDVHKMLYGVLDTFIQGGELGIFSPMYMVVLQKPKDD
jgi:24-methylenesterol C-methyltransferase